MSTRSLLRVSPTRLARRRRYEAYRASATWHQARAAWAGEEERRTGLPITCVVCGLRWELRRDDLHHMTYVRQGHEAHEDLVAVHRPCHEAIHRAFKNRRWHSIDRVVAMRIIINRLSHQYQHGAGRGQVSE